MFINGEWVGSSSGETFNDYSPIDESIYAVVQKGTREDAKRAIDAAYEAKDGWADTLGRRRADYLYKLYDVLLAKRDEIVDVIVKESGSTLRKANVEVLFTLNMIRSAAEEARRVSGETIPSDTGKFSLTIRQPAGVVACITPWNFPFQIPMRKILHAIALGNTVVLKPSSETPVIALKIAGLFEAVKIPRGVVNVVTGSGSEVGEELVTNRKVSRITFTGESSTGRHVAQKAGMYLKRSILELGGSDPLIILNDADVEYSAKAAVYGAFYHQGESCVSVKRIIVERELYDKFVKRFVELAKSLKVGDPTKPETEIGPMINKEQLLKVDEQVRDAVAKGAKVECGGTYKGLYYNPTVLTNVSLDMKVMREEVFGPARPVISVDSEDEAIRVANSSDYGLSAGVITNDISKALTIARKLECGMVHINDTGLYDEAHAPFGGVKDSGMGREGGKYSTEELTDIKWITIQLRPREFRF